MWALGREAFRRHRQEKALPSRGSRGSRALGVTSLASSADQKENIALKNAKVSFPPEKKEGPAKLASRWDTEVCPASLLHIFE